MHTARAQTAPAVKISHFEKSKMAQGGHLEKWPYLHNCLTDWHESWYGSAYWPSKLYWKLKF